MEAIQQQKREKTRLEAEVNRKEVELLEAEVTAGGKQGRREKDGEDLIEKLFSSSSLRFATGI